MYTAVYKKVREGYAAWIEEIPGINTQGISKKVAADNLRDALKEFIAARKQLTQEESSRGQELVREQLAVT